MVITIVCSIKSIINLEEKSALRLIGYTTIVGPVTTRNEATPGNEAKKTLPENVANFVGGYIFWEPHTQK